MMSLASAPPSLVSPPTHQPPPLLLAPSPSSPNVVVARANVVTEDDDLTALSFVADAASMASSSCFSLISDSEASGMLSDIDEVIRDDSNNNVNVGNSEGDGVIVLNICGVCQKVFTDPKVFKAHEAAGCIDFES